MITETAVIASIAQFQSASSQPVGFESDLGYQDPMKMKKTARMFAIVPMAPQT